MSWLERLWAAWFGETVCIYVNGIGDYLECERLLDLVLVAYRAVIALSLQVRDQPGIVWCADSSSRSGRVRRQNYSSTEVPA